MSKKEMEVGRPIKDFWSSTLWDGPDHFQFVLDVRELKKILKNEKDNSLITFDFESGPRGGTIQILREEE